MPSRFNLTVTLPQGRKAVYNSLTGSLLVVAARTWRRCLKAGCSVPARSPVPGNEAGILHAKGLLVSKTVCELDLLRLCDQTSRFSDRKLVVTLLPTMACNLRCHYCFENRVQAAGRGNGMTRAREEAIVRHIAVSAQGKQALEMSWFGGEPLLTAEAIARISARLIPACDQAGVRYSSTLVTNGTLLSRRVVRRLQKCRLKFIQVTLDIPATEKCDARGRETAGRVLDNLAFAARWLPIYLRINIVHDDPAGFDRLYQELLRRKLDRSLKAFFFAYVFDPECGGRNRRFAAMTYTDYVRIAARERRKAKAMGLPVEPDFRPSRPGCIATDRASMVITPDGRLFKCTEDVGRVERAYGTVEPGEAVELGNLVPWLVYDGTRVARCVRCPILGECGGGCAHIRRFQPGQLETMRYCEGHLEEIKDRIREWADGHARQHTGRDNAIVELTRKERTAPK